jgi:hypothetical protein
MTVRVTPRRCAPVRPALEQLESRRLLSASLTESEPNNSAARADTLPCRPEELLAVYGQINATGDHDWFKVQLRKGDVIGATVTGEEGFDTTVRLVNADGELLVGNDDNYFFGADRHLLPDESPLPITTSSSTDAGAYYVVPEAGKYFLDVGAFDDAQAGAYDLDLAVARPGLEAAPSGTRQAVFLDFDGSTVDMAEYNFDPGLGTATFASLADSLPRWGMSADKEDVIIDGILAAFAAKLGNVALTGGNDHFGVRVLNSRDHADPGDDPYVSRLRIGAIAEQAVSDLIPGGVAQFTDVGNFKSDDEAMVNLHFFDEVVDAIDAGFFAVHAPLTAVDVAITAFSDLSLHEFGHILGALHGEQPPQIVGPGAGLMDLDVRSSLGEDFEYGSADDVYLQYIAEPFRPEEGFTGINDTLTTVAFALSTGESRRPANNPGVEQAHGNRFGHSHLTLSALRSAFGGQPKTTFGDEDMDEDDAPR